MNNYKIDTIRNKNKKPRLQQKPWLKITEMIPGVNVSAKRGLHLKRQ